MFGCGLPVLALAYSCIHELVAEGRTGVLFSDGTTLADALCRLLAGFGADGADAAGAGAGAGPSELAALRHGVAAEQLALRWEDNWRAVAAPVLLGG
jgi:beta-1,4-mannosyltransferase